MADRDVFASALNVLLAGKAPFRERLADALLCLLCADTSRFSDSLPADIRDWIADLRCEVLHAEEAAPLSDAVRRWVAGLEGPAARDIAHRLVEAQSRVDGTS